MLDAVVKPSMLGVPYLPREPDLAEGFGAEFGRVNFGSSIVPVKRKLGGDAAAGDVAACKIDGRIRRFSV